MRPLYSLFFLLILLQCGTKQEVEHYLNYSRSLSSLVDSLQVQQQDLSLYIDKSDYTLAVMAGGKVIKEYPVVFGSSPVEDKRMEGDKRTPEGTFRIRDFYPHQKWSKFIWLDYPTQDSWQKHKAAKEKGVIPQEAKIGGEIGIHGVPQGYDQSIDQKINWTLGCISLKNKDVDDLYTQVHKGMLIKIVK